MAHFRIPLNLPHAGTIAARIEHYLLRLGCAGGNGHTALLAKVERLRVLLGPYQASGENPAEAEARRVASEVASMGRSIVDDIERIGLKDDRLGQCVRNLFECIERGEEGADLSLRAGENPRSPLRP